MINPKTYELESLHSRIWKNDNNNLELKIIFKNYETYRWQSFAKVTEYFIDNIIMKRMTVTKISTLSQLPIEKLEKQASNFRKLKRGSLERDYAL